MPNPSQEPPAFSKATNQDLKYMHVLCIFKIMIGSQILDHGCTKDQWPNPNQDSDAKPQSETSSFLQSPKSGLKGPGCSLHLQNQDRAEIWILGVPKTSDHIQIKIQIPNSSQEPPVSSKAPNQDLKDMEFFAPSKSR